MEIVKTKSCKNKFRPAAKYLGQRKDEIIDGLRWEKGRRIPILRNANCPDLTSCTVDGHKISLANTCAFDAVVHLLLTAAEDFDAMRTRVRSVFI